MDIPRRMFGGEFQIKAVKLVTERGVSVAQACRDLYLADGVLGRWMREATVAPTTAFPGNGQQRADLAEIAALKKEVARLRAEDDILKKAAAGQTAEAVWKLADMLASLRGRRGQACRVSSRGSTGIRRRYFPSGWRTGYTRITWSGSWTFSLMNSISRRWASCAMRHAPARTGSTGISSGVSAQALHLRLAELHSLQPPIGTRGGTEHRTDVVDGAAGECPIFCVTALWSLLPERSKDDDGFQGPVGRPIEELRAA